MACGVDPGPSEGSAEALAGEVAARVGGDPIAVETLQRVARAQDIPLSAARDRVIADALFARAAMAGPAGSARHQRAERIAFARSLLRQIEAEAQAAGPVTGEAIAERAEAEWWKYDRPELLRAVHAVVRFDEAKDEQKARAVAEQILAATRDATTAEAFVERARSVDGAGLEVRVEPLEPCAADGRVVDPTAPPPPGTEVGHYSAEFASGLHAIERDHTASGPFRSEFGFHVAMVVERFAETRLSDAELRAALGPEVLAARARERYRSLVDRLRGSIPVEVERSAIDLTEKVLRRP